VKKSGTPAAGLPYQNVVEVRNRVVAVIFSEDVRTDAGRALDRQLRARVPDAHVFYVDQRIANAMSSDVLAAVAQAEVVIAAVYAVPTPGRTLAGADGGTNTATIPDASGTLLQAILAQAAEKTMVVAMGSPYLAQDFPSVQNYLCAFSNAAVSEVSAVKALFGEIAIGGHLPVTIPGIAARGAGIERAMASGSQPQSDAIQPAAQGPNSTVVQSKH
jgi:beta-N-acetylhexosaminidase